MTLTSTPAAPRYQPRPIRAHGVVSQHGWRLKSYEITAESESIAAPIRAAADRVVSDTMGMVDQASSGPDPVGFSILHRGSQTHWLLVDFWTGDIITQHLFSAPRHDPTAFAPVPAGGPIACVWEMEVLAHERDAFVSHVMTSAVADFEGYLRDVIDTTRPSTRELVASFNKAWVRRDIGGLMDLMTAEPTYRASTGPGPGVDHIGADAVRAGFEQVMEAEAAIQEPPPPSEVILVAGNRAVAFWSYPAPRPDGTIALVEGVDLWTVADGKLALKDAYRKAFDDPA